MKTVDILLAYTKGEKNLEETNAALKEKGAGYHLDPMKNVLTDEEVQNGTAGLLDTGTGTLDKVQIDTTKMELIDCDCGDMFALCLIGGKVYEVRGKHLSKY